MAFGHDGGTVIPSQCSHWRGNPSPKYKRTDRHTSDVGHWFAMTERKRFPKLGRKILAAPAATYLLRRSAPQKARFDNRPIPQEG